MKQDEESDILNKIDDFKKEIEDNWKKIEEAIKNSEPHDTRKQLYEKAKKASDEYIKRLLDIINLSFRS